MHIANLTEKAQDYLKTIFDLQEWSDEPATLGRIAEQLNQRTSTASEAVKRLSAQGLVHHSPYSAIELTDTGRALALQMVRRHRLIETYLFEKLGYTLSEIHDEAEKLEHAVSDTFINRIEQIMDFPQRDPHGDPIPTSDGRLNPDPIISLTESTVGTSYTIDRISDRDPDTLNYLEAHDIVPNAILTVTARPFPDLIELSTKRGSAKLSAGVMNAVKLRINGSE